MALGRDCFAESCFVLRRDIYGDVESCGGTEKLGCCADNRGVVGDRFGEGGLDVAD